jgi:hypothetical protein
VLGQAVGFDRRRGDIDVHGGEAPRRSKSFG